MSDCTPWRRATGEEHRTWISSVSLLLIVIGLLVGAPATAEWTHRYPHQEGATHQVYLESFELPVMAAGPTDPAASPDGRRIAIAARGWLWIVDLATGTARRLTSDAGMDSRPAWSPDGREIAFVRDETDDTDLFIVDAVSGAVRPVVQSASLDLDPAWSADGRYLYYSSGAAGNLDIWRLHMESEIQERITFEAQLERRPQPVPNSSQLVFLNKRMGLGQDQLVLYDPVTAQRSVLKQQSIASQTHPGLSPDGTRLVFNWPGADGYDLIVMDLSGGDEIRLVHGGGLPLTPIFSADGQDIFYVRVSGKSQLELVRAPLSGGDPTTIAIDEWNWGVPTTQLAITTQGRSGAVPARISVTDSRGHPLLSDQAMTRFDSSSGRVYQYSGGVIRLDVPEDDIAIAATHGLTAPMVMARHRVRVGRDNEILLRFKPLWEPRQSGWYSGDHHYHMNYGGPYQLGPDDALLQLQAEDLDVGTPLLANLHHRVSDTELFRWKSNRSSRPVLIFGQEIRSHFHGHVGVIFAEKMFWPWFWGPGYPVYTFDDRPNAQVLRFAKEHGGVSIYVHPVLGSKPPFDSDENLNQLPLDIIPDALSGRLDAIEVACLYTNELHVSELWYRLLNVGVPLVATAGTDSFSNTYRGMAPGATRLYVKLDQAFTLGGYKAALKAGRSFVTTGPLIDFVVSGVRPGDTVTTTDGRTVDWEVMIASTQAVEHLEIIINGVVVHRLSGPDGGGRRTYRGALDLPTSGWIAARAYGGDMEWPGMNELVFAHSSPIWINAKGSRDRQAAAEAARDLLRALDHADTRIREGYGDRDIPQIREQFRNARAALEQMVTP